MTDVTSSPARVEALRRVPLFAGIAEPSLERLATIVTEVEVPAGHVLVERGTEGSGMFVLEEGTVAIELADHTLERGPGEFFGELALLAEGIRRTARVRAVTSARCLAISRRDFSELLEAEPSVAVAMLPELARRLADASTHL